MNWLKRLIVKWVREDWDDGRHSREVDSPKSAFSIPRARHAAGLSTSVTLDMSDYDNPVRFELSSAVGGRILTVKRYDPRKDQSDNQVYVIPQGEDVGARVSKILNLELLK